MPNYFSLTRKSDSDNGPVPLSKIDSEICQHFNEEVHPELYYLGWYDVIGFSLAMGDSFETIKAYISKRANETSGDNHQRWNRLREVAEYLEENFQPSAWATR